MPPPRPASGDTIYIIHAYGSVTNSMFMLACQFSQPNRPDDLDLWPLTLKVVSKSRVTWATSVPILVFLVLSVLDLSPMYATDRRQTASCIITLIPPGQGHNNTIPISDVVTVYSHAMQTTAERDFKWTMHKKQPAVCCLIYGQDNRWI